MWQGGNIMGSRRIGAVSQRLGSVLPIEQRICPADVRMTHVAEKFDFSDAISQSDAGKQ